MKSIFLNELINSDKYTLRELLDEWFYDNAELATFLNECACFNLHAHPDRGVNDENTYEGQPVVWDGVWEWREVMAPGIEYGGIMFYVGGDGPSGGSGKNVERLVDLDDKILFY